MNQMNNLARHTRLLENVGTTIRLIANKRAIDDRVSGENTDGERFPAQVAEAGCNLSNLQILLGRTALLVFAMHVAGCGDKDKDKAQTPSATATTQPAQSAPATPSASKPEAKPLTTLESLVAPIALYPDPLLAEVLVGATYPLEVVQAARWLESKPDPATLREKKWDASIIRLTAVPDVIAMMDQHLDWTTQLGDAFLSDPSKLMDAIQALRKRATDAGFLKESDLQKVETKTVSVQEPAQDQGVKATPAVYTKEVISIQPAKADTISVPRYNSEVVYAAPMAAPPASQMYPTGTVGAAPATGYYPTYYAQPAATTTTTTSSSTDQWMTFGAGALAGGLLTWGIMEWADDDDWDDYHVSHYYGNAVCNGGNCWHGGGGGYYGGNANVNRGNINVSGNEININRDGTFKPDQLPALKDRTGGRWQPDARHRRGQAFPPEAQRRIGRAESPALAGNRLGGAQSLPADMRGFGKVGGTADKSLAARPSSADIQQRLAAKPGKDTRPAKIQSERRPVQSSRDNALEGLRTSGQRNSIDSKRGASSLGSRQQAKGQARTQDRAGIAARRAEGPAPGSQRRAQQAGQRSGSQQQFARQRNEQTQQFQQQRRQETSRPNAFDSARDGGRSAAFSNRGNASRASAQPTSFGGQRAATRSAGAATRSGGGARSRGGRR